MTTEAFLAWNPPPGPVWQLLDGVPSAMAPPGATHAAIQAEASRLIGNHLVSRASPCTVVVTPGVVPRVNADSNVRIPDLAVTCAPIARGEATITDPVLVIEILSPNNQAETWANVWAYTTIPSVSEILVLRSSAVGADLLRRNADGAWPERPAVVLDGHLTLDSIAYSAPIADFYRTTWLARPL